LEISLLRKIEFCIYISSLPENLFVEGIFCLAKIEPFEVGGSLLSAARPDERVKNDPKCCPTNVLLKFRRYDDFSNKKYRTKKPQTKKSRKSENRKNLEQRYLEMPKISKFYST
jgi:hypothetical protein